MPTSNIFSYSMKRLPYKNDDIIWFVVAGDYNESADDDAEQTVHVAEIIDHPDPKMDLTLIRLSVPLSFNDNVDCISANTEVTDDMFSSAVCWATGWGMTTHPGTVCMLIL